MTEKREGDVLTAAIRQLDMGLKVGGRPAEQLVSQAIADNRLDDDQIAAFLACAQQRGCLQSPDETAAAPAGADSFLDEVYGFPLLTAEQQRALAERIRHDDPQARELMVNSHLRLVAAIVRRYPQSSLNFYDMFQSGMLGLMHAVGRFDPAKGASFGVYAAYWIRQAIDRGLNGEHDIRIPTSLSEELNHLHHSERLLTQKLGRRPDDGQLAAAMGVGADRVRLLRGCSFDAISIDSEVSNDNHVALAEQLSDGTGLQRHLDEQWLAQALSAALGQLDQRQADVLRWRYGLDGRDRLTLQQIARRLGVSKQRVAQIQAQALATLKDKEPSLKDFKQ